MAARLGRSRSKRPINSAAKCCASPVSLRYSPENGAGFFQSRLEVPCTPLLLYGIGAKSITQPDDLRAVEGDGIKAAGGQRPAPSGKIRWRGGREARALGLINARERAARVRAGGG